MDTQSNLKSPQYDSLKMAAIVALVLFCAVFVYAYFKPDQSKVNNATVITGDTTPPVVAIVSPVAGNVSGTYTITVQATDNTAISYVQIFRQFGAFTSYMINQDNTGPDYSFTTSMGGAGTYTLTARAYDTAGNMTVSAPVVICSAGITCSGATTGGTTSGSTTTGTTTGGSTTLPAAPTNLHVVTAQPTSLQLGWANANGQSGSSGYNPYGYTIYLNGTLKATSSTTSYTISGLTANTAYSVSVKAKNSSGVESAPVTISATTGTLDTQGPSPVNNFTATAKTTSTITVGWSPSTDNIGVTGYRMYKNGVYVGTATGTTYTYAGLNVKTTYSLYAKATDAAGNYSDPSTTLSITTNDTVNSGPDTQAPSAPGTLSFTGAMGGTADISWGAASDNYGVVGYKIYVDGGSNSNLIIDANNAGTSAGVPGCSINSYTYYFTVRAYDAAGNLGGASNTIKVGPTGTTNLGTDTTAPTVPTGITSTATATALAISWTVSTDAVHMVGYDIYKNGVYAGTTATPTYNFSGLTPSTTYSIGVKARDAAGNTSALATISTGTTAASGGQDVTPPTISLTVTNVGTMVTVTANTSDNVGVTEVNFYRSYNGGTSYQTGHDGTSPFVYTWDASGFSAATYTFTAQAYDDAGNYTMSAPVSFVRN